MSATAPAIDVSRFERFVSSPLAERVATVVELGGNFPRVSEDDWEQFLVEEAVLVPHAKRRADEQAEEVATADAHAQAKKSLQDAR